MILLPLQLRTHHIGQAPGPDGGSQDLPAEYHFKQQLLIQVARHVNCNKKQQLKKLEGKVRGLVVHRTQQTGRRIIAGRLRARIYFNRKEDTGP